MVSRATNPKPVPDKRSILQAHPLFAKLGPRRIGRLACLIVPGTPHHVTQRGNGRAPVFFEDGDYALYRDLLAERCRKASAFGSRLR